MIKHIKRWNKWRKNCLNGPVHKFLVLIKVIHSPTMGRIFLDEEIKAIGEAFSRGLNEENEKLVEAAKKIAQAVSTVNTGG